MRRDGLGLHAAAAALFAALSLAFLARSYDGSAFTYVILAERGEVKAQALLAHPLYLPLLGRLCGLNPGGPQDAWCLRAGQVLSVLGAGALLLVLQRLCLRWSGDARASAWASLAFVSEAHLWGFSHQTKPYSVAAALAAAALLVSHPGPGAGRARGAAAGLLAGLAMGFDLFNIVLVPSVLALRRIRGPARDGRFLLPFLAVSLPFPLAYAATWIGAPGETLTAAYSPSAMRSITLFHSNPLPGLAATAAARLLDVQKGALWIIPLVAAALSARRRENPSPAPPGLLPWAALHFAFMAAALILLHAGDHYCFFAWLGLPPLLACAARGPGRWRAVLGACAAASLGWSFATVVAPKAGAGRQAIEVEAAFLRRSLEPDDVLLVAGAPDWRLAYLARGSSRVLRLDQPPAESDPLGPPRQRIDPAVWPQVAAALARGRRVWLAADSLYRPEDAWGPAEVDAYQQLAQREILRRYSFASPRISPAGQWYLPLIAGPGPKRPPRLLQ